MVPQLSVLLIMEPLSLPNQREPCKVEKMRWYPHANKLLQKCVIFNKAMNLHSRGPTEQYFYVWESHCGCLHKVKKVCWCPFIGEGQQSHKIEKCAGTPMFYTTNINQR